MKNKVKFKVGDIVHYQDWECIAFRYAEYAPLMINGEIVFVDEHEGIAEVRIAQGLRIIKLCRLKQGQYWY